MFAFIYLLLKLLLRCTASFLGYEMLHKTPLKLFKWEINSKYSCHEWVNYIYLNQFLDQTVNMCISSVKFVYG